MGLRSAIELDCLGLFPFILDMVLRTRCMICLRLPTLTVCQVRNQCTHRNINMLMRKYRCNGTLEGFERKHTKQKEFHILQSIRFPMTNEMFRNVLVHVVP